MTDEPNEPDEPDDDTLAAFTKILTKVGPEWLKDQLKATTPPPSDPKPSGSLEAFLQDTLRETRETLRGMTDRMERMRDLLTPEQLIQLRSPPSGEDLPQNIKEPARQDLKPKPQPQPQPDRKVTPPRRKWL